MRVAVSMRGAIMIERAGLVPPAQHAMTRLSHAVNLASVLGLVTLLGACQASVGISSTSNSTAIDPPTVDAQVGGAEGAAGGGTGGATATKGDAQSTTKPKSKPKSPSAAAKKPKPKPKPKPKGPTLKELQAQLAKVQADRKEAQRLEGYARAELEISELEAASLELGVVELMRAARARLQSAQASMDRFDRIERPLAVGAADLRLSEAEYLMASLTPFFDPALDGAFVESESPAGQQLAVAEAARALALEKRTLIVEHTLPALMRDKSEAVRAAEAALAQAVAVAAQTRRKSELAVEMGVDTVDDAKRVAKQAAKRVENARRRVNDKREAQIAQTKTKAKKKAKTKKKDTEPKATEPKGSEQKPDAQKQD